MKVRAYLFLNGERLNGSDLSAIRNGGVLLSSLCHLLSKSLSLLTGSLLEDLK